MAFVFERKMIIARPRLVALLIGSILTCSFQCHSWAQDENDKEAAGTTAMNDSSLQQDEFSGWQSISPGEMSQYSGGTETSFGDVGINLATNSSSLIGNSVDGNVETGKIQDLNLNDIGGINTLMFNTGNNVNFQSNMLINIFVK
ncbi:hypothetical protein [Emcibacter nanhaiensis]|uniref:Uncharacterized protein n=1 Tax=Emcibacter nanhaiensis TaxID=1505037 RepID=A0A501PJP7_9PROT|nr:hypothetical protein [Emcibacter nanhaiensis]TPD60689.1 hypothetical protein FIV46_08150 [Emcibacter nanhaiensis]